MNTTLTPAQQHAFDRLQRSLPLGRVFVLNGAHGSGRSTVLRALHAAHGGALLSMRDALRVLRDEGPWSIETSFEALLIDAVERHEVVFVDDLDALGAVVDGCGAYPLHGLMDIAVESAVERAIELGHRIVFAEHWGAPRPVAARAFNVDIDRFAVADYSALLGAWLPAESVARIDVAKVHRFAPRLSAWQLRGVCAWLRDDAALDTERFIHYLREKRMTSNVDLGEVQAVDLAELKGMGDVIEALEAGLITPLENDALASELGLRPKRGVLLAGPPGTGKTTLGRALAHRLKSKFFMIDGTFVAGTHGFYDSVQRVFRAARENAPSVLFIDDGDVIFASGQESGLYRYLLTMLDGLESESASRVCVVITAMDVSQLPPALVRSGRIELWLETRLPDHEARRVILAERTRALPAAMGAVDLERLARGTDGFTGADLKRLVEDGKLLYAHDVARGRPTRGATEYFLVGVEALRVNCERYREAETRARAKATTT